jgi:hypothetical protein
MNGQAAGLCWSLVELCREMRISTCTPDESWILIISNITGLYVMKRHSHDVRIGIGMRSKLPEKKSLCSEV